MWFSLSRSSPGRRSFPSSISWFSRSPFLRPDLRIPDVDARRICTRLAVTPRGDLLFGSRSAQHSVLGSVNSSNFVEITWQSALGNGLRTLVRGLGTAVGALPSAPCVTFRETRFVQYGFAVTRSGHVLIPLVGTYAGREAEKDSVETSVLLRRLNHWKFLPFELGRRPP
jgi:hypothetical protein